MDYKIYEVNYVNVEKPFKTLADQIRENFALDEEYNEEDYRVDFFKDFPEFKPKPTTFDEENYDCFCMPQLI